MKKILFVGNSFSQNATRYVEAIADGELFVRNLYIGGCPLSLHVENIHTGEPSYEYQKDAVSTGMISLDGALDAEDWDAVSVQQVSSLSGIADSYEPYITELLAHIREKKPVAQLVFHRTWAYEDSSEHPAFEYYSRSRERMYEMIERTVSEIASRHNLPVIPSGVAVERARELPELDTRGGGSPITVADGFHLNGYGEYLAGLVLYKFFTGKSPLGVSFVPSELDASLCEKLKRIADEV
ncbi:MAG: DUF4886 domain-containing protein [Clostridia bacterium]|nr:DUF4886 domain-containing protein [Clostridia bacterium]